MSVGYSPNQDISKNWNYAAERALLLYPQEILMLDLLEGRFAREQEGPSIHNKYV